MKKIISVLVVISMLLAFAGCSGKTDVDDKQSTNAPEASQQGSADEKNEGEVSKNKDDKQPEKATDGKADEKSTAADKTTKKNSDSKTTEASTSQKPTEDKTTKKETTTKETTTKETTTKRKIKLDVIYPYYNGETKKVKIEYKQSKDKKYTELVKDEEITLDRRQTVSYEIKDKVIGDIDVKFTIDGVELMNNKFVVSGKDKEATIELIAGVESLDGGLD